MKQRPMKIVAIHQHFLSWQKSNYILDEDLDMIHEVFPRSMLETISDAGHWVHAEKPKAFYDCVINFIK